MIPVNPSNWWDQNGYQDFLPGDVYNPDQPAGGIPGNPGNPDIPVDPGQGRITDNPYGTGAPPAKAGGQGPVTMADFDAAWQASPYPGTVDGLKQFYAAHPEYAAAGITLGGSKGDKVYGPGGAYWGDAVIAAGLGGQGKSRLSGDPGGGAGAAGGLAAGYMTAPYTKEYKLPTLDELQAMPGYQAGLKAVQKNVETGAASRGTLLTGGTLRGLNQASQDYASQQYGNLAGLGMGAFNTNYNIFRNNQNDPFSKYLSLAQLGKPT